ncbi:MAG: hypothetical protein IKQ36_07275 [Clostridia bacterium]|nr:hypothetical protein [Clostridia bacterium]
MKRILALTLCILTLFLCACQPTPDHDIIINQGEADQAGMGKRNTPDPNSTDSAEIGPIYYYDTREGIPEHCKVDRFAYSDLVSMEIDADVSFDREGVFPVYEVKKRDIIKDKDLMKHLIYFLCPDSVVYYAWERTKKEISVELEAMMNYHGQADSVLEIDASTIRDVQEEYKAAPDEPNKIPVNMDLPLELYRPYYLERKDGSCGFLVVNGINHIAYDITPYLWTYEKRVLTPEELAQAGENSITKEEAIRQAEDFLQAMGFDGYSLMAADDMAGHAINTYEWTGSYWKLNYVRSIGKTMTIDERKAMYHMIVIDKGMASSVGAPWDGMETIRIIVGKEGIAGVMLVGLTEIVDEMEKDVPFIDFDSLIERVEDHLCYRFGFVSDERIINVSAIQLVYGLTCYKDKTESGIYMPMWEVEYTLSDDMNVIREQQAYFSAIDGSPMEPRSVLSGERPGSTMRPNGQLPRH